MRLRVAAHFKLLKRKTQFIKHFAKFMKKLPFAGKRTFQWQINRRMRGCHHFVFQTGGSQFAAGGIKQGQVIQHRLNGLAIPQPVWQVFQKATDLHRNILIMGALAIGHSQQGGQFHTA